MHSDPKTSMIESRNPTQFLSFRILALGILSGFLAISLIAEPDYPHPRELWAIYWVGEGVVCALSLVFLGFLAYQTNRQYGREALRPGEWVGITTSVLILSGMLMKCLTPRLSGPGFVAYGLFLCLVWIAAVGLLLARPFITQRSGYRPTSYRTELGGLLLSALADPFMGWQLAHSLTYL